MGMTTKQFNGYLRLVLSAVQDAIKEEDIEKKQLLLEQIAENLQSALVKERGAADGNRSCETGYQKGNGI